VAYYRALGAATGISPWAQFGISCFVWFVLGCCCCLLPALFFGFGREGPRPLIRDPGDPPTSLSGRLDHEFVWPAVFLSGAGFAWVWFWSGLQLPQCVFIRLTGLPCLGCGGTRCARNLVNLDFAQAFLYHPGFFLVVLLAAFWTAYAAVFWIRRDTLRLRFFVEPAQARRFRVMLILLLVAHWPGSAIT
jgi:hypothetical protein